MRPIRRIRHRVVLLIAAVVIPAAVNLQVAKLRRLERVSQGGSGTVVTNSRPIRVRCFVSQADNRTHLAVGENRNSTGGFILKIAR